MKPIPFVFLPSIKFHVLAIIYLSYYPFFQNYDYLSNIYLFLCIHPSIQPPLSHSFYKASTFHQESPTYYK